MTHGMPSWPRRVGVVTLVWLAVCVVLSLAGDRPSYGLVALVVGASAGVVLLLVDASARVESPDWRLPLDTPVRPPGEDPRLSALTRAVDAHLVSRQVGAQLHDQVMSVVDRRLLTRHGISRRSDPERAAALMGPELAGFAAMTGPYPRLTVQQIDVLIDRIEDL